MKPARFKLQIVEESLMTNGPLFSNTALNTTSTQYDTFEITEIYLERPINLRDLKLSQWFCLAHGLQDWELQNAASLGDCKRQMINKRYVFLSLEPLKEYNKAQAKKG